MCEATEVDTAEVLKSVAESEREVVHRRSFVPAAQGGRKPSNKDCIIEAHVSARSIIIVARMLLPDVACVHRPSVRHCIGTPIIRNRSPWCPQQYAGPPRLPQTCPRHYTHHTRGVHAGRRQPSKRHGEIHMRHQHRRPQCIMWRCR